MDDDHDYSDCGMGVAWVLMLGGLLLVAVAVLMGGPL